MRVCNICGITDDEAEFYKGRNRCRSCALAIIAKYNKERNKDPKYITHRRERWKKWKNGKKRMRNPEVEKQSKQSSPRRFMTDMVAHLRRFCKKNSIPFNIDLDYVSNQWAKQMARCAVTGINMTYENKDLKNVRIDAIDENKGYTKGNIQLVCDGIKRMKKGMSNEDMLRFVREIKEVIMI